MGTGRLCSGNAEQGSESGVPRAPAVEAEDEFIEIRLEVLAAQPMVDAQGPDREVSEDPANPKAICPPLNRLHGASSIAAEMSQRR